MPYQSLLVSTFSPSCKFTILHRFQKVPRFSSTERFRYGLSLPGSFSVPLIFTNLFCRQITDICFSFFNQLYCCTHTSDQSSWMQKTDLSFINLPLDHCNIFLNRLYKFHSFLLSDLYHQNADVNLCHDTSVPAHSLKE